MDIKEIIAGFDPDFASPLEWARIYRGCGLQVVPACSPHEVPKGGAWKRPKLNSWTKYCSSLIRQDEFDAWYAADGLFARHNNMGVITGTASGNLFVVDLDIHKKQEALGWWVGLLAVHNDGSDLETAEQQTGGGGLQKLFRAPLDWHCPTGKTSIGVDIRGQGGFAVLAPSLHDTEKLYSWLPGRAPWDDVGIATAPQWLLEAVDDLIEANGGGETGALGTRTASPGGDYDAFGHQHDGREEKMRSVVWGAVLDWHRERQTKPTAEEQRLKAAEKYLTYEDQVTSRLADPAKTKTQLLDEEEPQRGPAAFWVKWQYAMNKWDTKVAAEAAKPKPGEFVVEPEAEPLERLEVEPIFVGDLTGEPKKREWIVPDWIPKGVVSSLSGDGGMGKTLIAQQLLYAAGVGGKWLGLDVPPTRGLGVFCEDDEDELHRRHNAIKTDLGHAVGNPFTDTWIWPRVGYDNLLVTFDRDNKPLISPFFAQIMRHVMEKRIELLVLDTIADLFGGNEIIRAQVNYFIKATCGAFIKQAKDAGFVLTVILLSHPSQAGRNSGSGESGSTAWNNAVRARLYLTRPEDGLPEQRVLTRKKSNYSASGDDVKIDLLWSGGVLKPAADNKVSVVAIKSVETQIINMVDHAWDDGRPYKAKKGPRFLDAAMVDFFRNRVERGVIIAALNNLRNEEKIAVDRVGDRRGYRVPSNKNEG